MAIQQLKTPYLQIIRRTLCLLAVVLLAAACSKEEESAKLSGVPENVVLRSPAGSQAAFTVQSTGAWTLTSAGSGYTVSPAAGGRGETLVTLTASEANPGRKRVKLGTVTLRLTETGQEYPVAVEQSPAVAPQTMLLYMPGRDLLRFYQQNIAGIEEAVSARVPGDGRILVCYQPVSHTQAMMYEIYYDPVKQSSALSLLTTYTDFSAADPDDVAKMLSDVGVFAPAEHYGIVVGCHGKAWVPANLGVLDPYSLRMSGHEDIWTPMPGALVTRSFGDTRYSIDIADFAAAIEKQDYRTEYLIFDACFMANVETLYDLKGCTDYVVAAPCEIMGQGFPYNKAVPWLFADDGARYDLQKVCEVFWKFYTTEATTKSGCISLAVMSEMDGMADVVRRINAAPKKSYSDVLQSYEGMASHIFFDLGHWVELACGDEALKAEFNRQLDKAFPKASRLNTPQFYSAYNNQMNPVVYYSGVSFSEPSAKYTQENKQTAWYRATH